MAEAIVKSSLAQRDPHVDIPVRTLSNTKFNKSKRIVEMGASKQRRNLFNLGLNAKLQNDRGKAREYFAECHEIFTELGDRQGIEGTSHYLGELARIEGDLPESRRLLRDAIEISRELGFPLMAGSSLPVTWRRPPMEVPHGAPVKHAVGIAMWDLDSYGSRNSLKENSRYLESGSTISTQPTASSRTMEL